jgi:hypothetical protein
MRRAGGPLSCELVRTEVDDHVARCARTPAIRYQQARSTHKNHKLDHIKGNEVRSSRPAALSRERRALRLSWPHTPATSTRQHVRVRSPRLRVHLWPSHRSASWTWTIEPTHPMVCLSHCSSAGSGSAPPPSARSALPGDAGGSPLVCCGGEWRGRWRWWQMRRCGGGDGCGGDVDVEAGVWRRVGVPREDLRPPVLAQVQVEALPLLAARTALPNEETRAFSGAA